MRNMNDIVRQANVMQAKLLKLQQEMGEKVIETSSGGGMVKVEMYCKQEIKSLTIDPKVMADGDVEMLQDLILAAVNEAYHVAKAAMDREVATLTGGIRLPGIM